MVSCPAAINIWLLWSPQQSHFEGPTLMAQQTRRPLREVHPGKNLPVYLTQHDIQCPDDRDHVCHQVSDTKFFQRLKINQ
jgi:hypothetical protein